MKIISILIFIGLLSFENRDNETLKYDKIILKRISGGRTFMTSYRINCDSFEDALSYMEIESIECTKFQDRINNYIINSYLAPEFENSIDTRSKLLFYKKSILKDSICLGRTKVFLLNGTSYFLKDRSLLDLIDSL